MLAISQCAFDAPAFELVPSQTMEASRHRRLGVLGLHLRAHKLAADVPTLHLDSDAGIRYAQLELPGKGATPERVSHLGKYGFVILDDFADRPLIPVMRDHARRIARECTASYPQAVHTSGYIHRGV